MANKHKLALKAQEQRPLVTTDLKQLTMAQTIRPYIPERNQGDRVQRPIVFVVQKVFTFSECVTTCVALLIESATENAGTAEWRTRKYSLPRD